MMINEHLTLATTTGSFAMIIKKKQLHIRQPPGKYSALYKTLNDKVEAIINWLTGKVIFIIILTIYIIIFYMLQCLFIFSSILS